MQPAERSDEEGQAEGPAQLHEQDFELARAALAGSSLARQRFAQVMTCVPKILSVKNTRLGSPLTGPELEDLAQEIVLTIWRKLETYRGAAALTTWTYSFCQFGLLANLRKRASRAPSLEYQEIAGPSVVADEFRFEHVYRALEKIDSGDAAVIRMKHFESLSFDDIASRISVPSSTVKTNYYRALGRLREILGPDESETLS